MTLSGRVYYYDAADTTSAHDGVNVLVDIGGRRYLLPTALQIQSSIWRIVDKDLSAPPGSPVNGTAYIVAAGASGAWAGQSGKIALRVAGTWAFSTPLAGAQAWLRAATNADLHAAFPDVRPLPRGDWVTPGDWLAQRPFAAPATWVLFTYTGA